MLPRVNDISLAIINSIVPIVYTPDPDARFPPAICVIAEDVLNDDALHERWDNLEIWQYSYSTTMLLALLEQWSVTRQGQAWVGIARQASVLVVGTFDTLMGLPVERTLANVREIVKLLRQHMLEGYPVVVVGVPVLQEVKEKCLNLSTAIEQACSEMGVMYVCVREFDDMMEDRRWTADVGYEVVIKIADKLGIMLL